MKLRPIFKCHGGKWYTHQWIIANFPKNYTELKYYEGCGGAASVLLNKDKSVYEAYNDADTDISRIIAYLKSPSPNPFINAIESVEYNSDSFEWAKDIDSKFGLERAVAELVLRRMSRGGLRKTFAWSNRLRGGLPGDVNAWETFKDQLKQISERLKDVEVFSVPIVQLIADHDDANALWYIDPPYLPSSRQVTNVYTVEMTETDHIELAKVLNEIKGKACLSGYQSPLYAKLYKDWNMVCRPIANHASQAKIKQKRIEILLMNY